MRATSSSGWSDRVSGPAAPSLRRLRVLHPPKLPPRCHSFLHVTVLSAYAAVSHGSTTHEAPPQLDRWQLFDSQLQNPCKASAGTKCNPSGYYHITWGGASGWAAGGRLSSCYSIPSAAVKTEATELHSTSILQEAALQSWGEQKKTAIIRVHLQLRKLETRTTCPTT